MILDNLLVVSSGQQVTADAFSSYSVDCENVTPKRQVGSGEPMAFVMAITAIGTTSGSSKIQVVESSAADLNTTPVVIAEQDLATADLAAGKVYCFPIPAGRPLTRYIGMYHDITGTVDYTVTAALIPLSFAQMVLPKYAKGYSA